MSLAIVLVALVPCVLSAANLPWFSWDTLPVFVHSENGTGPWSDAALKQLGRFSMVTMEKTHNNIAGRPEVAVPPECRRIKEMNPNTTALYYLNSEIDYYMYMLHDKLLANESLRLIDAKGEYVQYFPGVWVFNHPDPEMAALWQADCLNAQANGCDGCYFDRSDNSAQPGGAYPLNDTQVAAWQAAHMGVIDSANKALNENGGFAVFNNQVTRPSGTAGMLENFGASEACITKLQYAASQGLVIQAHAGDTPDGSDQFCLQMTNSLSAFLIGSGEHHYYHCSSGLYTETSPGSSKWSSATNWPVDRDEWLDWAPEFGRPLGAPLGAGVKGSDGVWRRSFSTGTNVTFDANLENGTIFWSDGHVQQGLPNATAGGTGSCSWTAVPGLR